MNCFIKRLIKPIILIILFLFNNTVKAQVSLLQNTIDQLESYKNYSYEHALKQKEEFSDTLTLNEKYILLKAPDDKDIGYFFIHKYQFDGKVPVTYLYNGTNLLSLNPTDSTYSSDKTQATEFTQTLPGELNWMKTFLKKNPSKIARSNDTTFNSINCYHIMLTTYDTVINKDHLYTRMNLFIDKSTGLPVGRISRSRNAFLGKEVTNYYTEEDYNNYKIDQDNINAAFFAIPKGFHLPKDNPREQSALLPPGVTAPDWTLDDTDGKTTSLSQMKGKIVLLDFFFIGCGPCLNTLAPLDSLYEKYKAKNFVLLSISTRDNEKLITSFKKYQLIKYQMYPGGGDVAKLYHVSGAPTFYFIDQNGKIESAILGYADDMEQKMSSIIDKLLNK